MTTSRAITRRRFIGSLAGAAAGVATGCARGGRGVAPGQRPPNIVVIFTDDQGYGDLSCFGSKTIRTPHADRLAADGVKFTDFYVCASICSPSRVGLLTGRYPIRTGITRVLFPRDKVGLSDREITIADGLKARGYATACIGKWHLGHHVPFLPTRHGFDFYYGIPYSNDMQPVHIYHNETVHLQEVDQSMLTELYTEQALKFIKQSKDRPFFLYLPHTMPHVPLFVSDRFKGKSKGGLYGDVIECIDWSTGQILDALRQYGIEENTLVIFTSDNGPWLEKKDKGGNAGPLRDGKFSVYEGGFREPFVARWPAQIPAGTVVNEPAMTLDFLPTFLSLAGAEVPSDRPIDGKNIADLLRGKGRSPHEMICYYRGTNLSAVRVGNWKYHRSRQTGRGEKRKTLPPELYDLSEDIGEKNNVAAEHPDVVEKIENRIKTWNPGVKPGRPGKLPDSA